MRRSTVRSDLGPEKASQSTVQSSSPWRFLRLTIGLGLIGLPTWFLMPTLWTVTSTQAVVNGHVIIMTSSIEGFVTLAPPPVLQPVATRSILARVDATVVDRGRLDELEAEAATLTECVAAIKDRIAAAESLKDDLETNYQNYLRSMIGRVSHELAEVRMAENAALVEAKQRAFEERQERALAARRFSSDRELTQANSAAAVSLAHAGQTTAAVARLACQLESIKGGTFTGPGDSRNDVPYSRQRIHDITIQRLRDDSEVREKTVRIAQLRRQIDQEQERIRHRSSYQLEAPVDGIVWQRSVAAGNPVTAQTELLRLVERSTLFVDALVSARYIDNIKPGDEVIIRAMSSTAQAAGRIRYVLGEDAVDSSSAVEVPRHDKLEVHVIIDFIRDSTQAQASSTRSWSVSASMSGFPGATRSALRLGKRGMIDLIPTATSEWRAICASASS